MLGYYVIGINILIFGIINFLAPSLMSHFGVHQNSLSYPYTFFTANFNHGGIVHLAFNMFFMYQFSRFFERYYNLKEQIFVYFISGIPVMFLSFLYIYFVEPKTFLIGYSGVCFVLFGASYKFLDDANRNNMVFQILILHILIMAFKLPVAWYAHLFGFIVGYLYAMKPFIKNFEFGINYEEYKKEKRKKKFKVLK
jgi:membrane associated rhomboid family serine protease